MLVCMMLDS